MSKIQNYLRAGVYVDVSNITMNGGYGMQYDILREFACRDGATPVRLNAYISYDPERERSDRNYREAQFGFHDKLREQGFKVILKYMKWYSDESGRIGKANADLDLAVDALLQSENLDRVLLATGDGDFVQVVNALQNRGCRVEIVAFDNVSGDLRSAADMYFSGYLVPGLLPVADENGKKWGEIGSAVRGQCYYFNQSKKFGFMRFLEKIDSELWKVDTRLEDSPYKTAYFRADDFQNSVDLERLPNRDMVFEFLLAKNPVSDSAQSAQLQAVEIRVL